MLRCGRREPGTWLSAAEVDGADSALVVARDVDVEGSSDETVARVRGRTKEVDGTLRHAERSERRGEKKLMN